MTSGEISSFPRLADASLSRTSAGASGPGRSLSLPDVAASPRPLIQLASLVNRVTKPSAQQQDASPGPYQVGPDTVVHFRYELLDEEGELVEVSDPDSELSFLWGYGQLAPAFEQALDGMVPGQSRDVLLKPEQAYGHRDPEAIIEVDRSEFPPGLQPGDEFEAEHESGEAVCLMILEVLDDRVVLDTNHPLAGQSINLRVAVEAVRPATADELAFADDQMQTELSANPKEAVSESDFTPQGLLPAALLLRRAASPKPGEPE